jgi:hypothetical protein
MPERDRETQRPVRECVVEAKFLEWRPVVEIEQDVFVAVREDKDGDDAIEER